MQNQSKNALVFELVMPLLNCIKRSMKFADRKAVVTRATAIVNSKCVMHLIECIW